MLKVFADRGGTFTDLVAVTDDRAIVARLAQTPHRFQITGLPNARWTIIYKLLSEQPDRYPDAVIQGIRDLLGLEQHEQIPVGAIAVVKMGTTVATNALLERKGDRTLLLITAGFADALRIGYQNRPDLFARQIVLPEMLYERVVEVTERYSAQGEELMPILPAAELHLTQALQTAYAEGMRACAIVFMHGYRYPKHEQQVAEIAQRVGFTQISVSHQVSPLMKLVSRGDTTVVDAYLSPILRRYIDRVAAELIGTKLEFMKSDGGLTDARLFQGKDSILSGPAGGIVGAVKTSMAAGFDKIIGFDMGGTSTDVSHFNGDYERTLTTEIAGVRLRAPMMSIHTIAAGGGSLLQFDGARYRVGPTAAGAHPGPACYRHGGSLTVTDCNVLVGKIQPEFFPQVFGAGGNLPLDGSIVQQQFGELTAMINEQTGDIRTPEQVAAGFLAIAIAKMAKAIAKISVQRGYDLSEYTLCCFGGAGGQHACLIAEALGMSQIFIHPLAGVLSAYGIGLADVRILKEKAVELPLTDPTHADLTQIIAGLTIESRAEVAAQGVSKDRIQVLCQAHLRYEGTDSTLTIEFGSVVEMRSRFDRAYRQRYSFTMDNKALIVEAVSVEAIGLADPLVEPLLSATRTTPCPIISTVRVFTKDNWHDTPIYRREDLQPGDKIIGSALIIEPTGTNVIEPDWSAELTQHNCLILRKDDRQTMLATTELTASKSAAKPDPVLLEIFNNLVRAIAEEMGIVLQNTSYSVNIKERLDFSCAIFDTYGQLIANAPHIPVHLGSMSASITSLIRAQGDTIAPGDVYISNNPYNGGTHLPDITAITPIFIAGSSTPAFYVASRGHHADIGGITPGSMPPHSTEIEQEGILLDNFQLVAQGHFREAELLELLGAGNYPVRNPTQNLGDLRAQIAANERGVQELRRTVEHYGLPKVWAYMQHVRNNAEESVRRAILQWRGYANEVLQDGSFTYPMDDGTQIQVRVTIDRATRSASIDFTGTSPQQPTNLNAPLAICKAVVLYVFRTLVEDDIPLNAGCLEPLEIIVPEGCLLNPRYPAAVVAGNVETSQAILQRRGCANANALYGALGMMAAAQGTMNNFTFGNDLYQYYETICGGAGAGSDFNGTDAVQTHMTNSRLTDPEVLEWRFPVLVEQFAIRHGSGGVGKYSGGNGVIRRIKFRFAMTAAILSGHRMVAPFGISGGGAGEIGRNSIEYHDGTSAVLGSKAEVHMQPGDVFVIETPGGGGYGAVSSHP
ncbi:hydantoinase B/oxoprolinase family protein [Chamaesiphon sp.]|uniref:hydantoinase B/oxoprolinase family protein n=1 Tax=Chamaesiphon sp. TaxID=2814140 RepID=UPI003593B177